MIYWDYDSNVKYNQRPIKMFKGHKFEIVNVLISPINKYIVSVGDSNDKSLFLWDF